MNSFVALFVVLQTVSAQTCISLKGSRNCAGLDNYAIIPSSEFSDLNGLDSFLDTAKFTDSNFISGFKSMFQCPNFEGRGGRYGMSSYCAFLVAASEGQCKSQYAASAAPLTLCASTCQAHMTSIKSIFSNSTVCDQNPQTSAADQRSTTVQPSQTPPNIAQFCSDLQNNAAAQTTATCFAATTTENQTCGFLHPDETTAHCASTPSDPCCTAAKAAASSGGTSVLNPVNNTFVIAGIVAAVLVFLGIVYIVFQRMSKQRQRPTTAYEPNRESKFKSAYFNNNITEPVPSLPQNLGRGETENRRSSLFTTMRASQIFGNASGAPPPMPPLPSQYDSQYDEESGQGFKVQVFEDYDAGMEDEMSCNVGDIIIVREEFDDGWATGLNITSGDEGIFPMAICEDLGAPTTSRVGRPRSALSARTQSLLPQARY